MPDNSLPAFPMKAHTWNNHQGIKQYHMGASGMSLRDYFAGQALPTVLVEANAGYEAEKLAEWAYKIADAMLAERER